MRFGQRDIDWEMVGAELARANDDEQATLFRGFLNELRKACGTDLAIERQLIFINDKLEASDRELIGIIGYADKGGTK